MSKKEIIEKAMKRRRDFFAERLEIKTSKEYNGEMYLVSTVELLHVMDFGDCEKLSYETMVFQIDKQGVVNYSDLYCNRYTNEEDAKKGHQFVVANLPTIIENEI